MDHELKNLVLNINQLAALSDLINMTVVQQLFLVMRILIRKRLKLI